jgi:hypothetical protein
MTYERRFRYFDGARHAVKQFARDVYLVARQWVRLVWHLGVCLVLTSRLLVRMIKEIVRVLTPVPWPVGQASRLRRSPTGLSVPTFDLMVLVFGIATVIGHVW